MKEKKENYWYLNSEKENQQL